MATLKLLPDLTVTLKGINLDDLRSILTAASIHHYEGEKEIAAKTPDPADEPRLQEVVAQNIADEKDWCQHLRGVIDDLEKQVSSEIIRHNRRRKRR